MGGNSVARSATPTNKANDIKSKEYPAVFYPQSVGAKSNIAHQNSSPRRVLPNVTQTLIKFPFKINLMSIFKIYVSQFIDIFKNILSVYFNIKFYKNKHEIILETICNQNIFITHLNNAAQISPVKLLIIIVPCKAP